MKRDLKNIAIIAHIDHGKTTLVDGLLKQSGVFRPGQKVDERVMDSNDLERERGITILSKNTSVRYGDTHINIVDTPGHADFAGEVERVLGMVDGCLLVVDAAEGPMAQTRFVVSKALAQGLVPILVVNKIDRPDGRPEQVVDEVLELFFALDAQDHQIEFPIVYCSAKDQVAALEADGPYENLAPLFESIVEHVPSPAGDPEAPLQLRVSSLDYDDYIGRLAIGRISQGTLRSDQSIAYGTPDDTQLHKNRLSGLFLYDGLGRKKAKEASVGDIVVVAGLVDVEIGDTITNPESPSLLPPIKVDEPTLAMNFMTSDSPLSGRDGKLVTSRHLKERLERELERNVALRVIPTDSPDTFEVCGRGELHLGILLETMRREGYELSVSAPRVLFKDTDEGKMEPIEALTVDLPEDYVGSVVERLGERKGEMLNMTGAGTGRVRLEYRIPMRGLIGFRSELLTLTRGYGIMSHLNDGYGPFKGEFRTRHRGSLIASDAGTATTYALHQLQDRGTYFISPQATVYAGMVVGEHCRPGDLEVNVCKKKQVTNIRSSTAEQTLRLEVPREMNLEKSLEYIADDELVEITPNSVRIRKRALCPHVRARLRKEKKAALQAAEG
jgi:GTP-binding protein